MRLPWRLLPLLAVVGLSARATIPTGEGSSEILAQEARRLRTQPLDECALPQHPGIQRCRDGNVPCEAPEP